MIKQRLVITPEQSALAILNEWLMSPQACHLYKYILVDENTLKHCMPLLIEEVPALNNAEFFEVPIGEEAKTVEVATQLWRTLLESNADSSSLIINLGGGCISDLGGFVAACYKRNIHHINIPTTLIGMADAAIGGKTAVNLDNVKNAIGCYHFAQSVYIHPPFLESLPDEEMVSGLFEVVKTLLLSSPEMFVQFEKEMTSGIGYHDMSLDSYINHCANFKADVVKADPEEKSLRRILNLGHTFGHAIESLYMERGSHLMHGIAVGIGLWCSLYLSVKKIGLEASVLDAYNQLLHTMIHVPAFTLKDIEVMMPYMLNDKKNRQGMILAVLLQEVGAPVIDVPLSNEEVVDTLLQVGKA